MAKKPSHKSQKSTPNSKPTTNRRPPNSYPAKNITSHRPIKTKSRTTAQKVLLASLICIAILLAGGTCTALVLLFNAKDDDSGSILNTDFGDPIYSALTGGEISDAKLNTSPTYCVQIPNGSTDGARPQAGLGQAAVVFEAIAERGITRFAAVFQNANVSAIGPVRSLRPYYLDWDTPFDCTVVHAGGSDEALTAINFGGQRNLDESLDYMWRETSNRAWNNLFTSPSDIDRFNSTMGYTTSNPKVFPRYTPDETTAILSSTVKDCSDTAATDDATACTPREPVDYISINFGSVPAYNTIYQYDLESNRYFRSYADGTPHTSYNCPSSLTNPDTTTACGDPVQLAPSAIVAMSVRESTANDGYHEDINTISSGNATIFQNGDVINATWSKASQGSQISFQDAVTGEEIKFTPGQLWIAAVPQYGSVDY